jgi:hypothetical protein
MSTPPKTRGLTGKDKKQAGLVDAEPSLPTDNTDLPEGLRRQRRGPYDRDRGRDDKLPRRGPARRK